MTAKSPAEGKGRTKAIILRVTSALGVLQAYNLVAKSEELYHLSKSIHYAASWWRYLVNIPFDILQINISHFDRDLATLLLISFTAASMSWRFRYGRSILKNLWEDINLIPEYMMRTAVREESVDLNLNSLKAIKELGRGDKVFAGLLSILLCICALYLVFVFIINSVVFAVTMCIVCAIVIAKTYFNFIRIAKRESAERYSRQLPLPLSEDESVVRYQTWTEVHIHLAGYMILSAFLLLFISIFYVCSLIASRQRAVKYFAGSVVALLVLSFIFSMLVDPYVLPVLKHLPQPPS